MPKPDHQNLTRRERQIMDVIYRHGGAAVTDVLKELPNPPTYSAVRAMLGKLEVKGYLRHAEKGARYVYSATVPRESARESALERLVRTFFDDSASKTMAALLDLKGDELSVDELDTLARMIASARQKEGDK